MVISEPGGHLARLPYKCARLGVKRIGSMFHIDIIVVYLQRYRRGHEVNFVPPITGIYLAALTPAHYRVRVIHQQIEPIDYHSDADLIALSFFSGFAEEAYRLAAIFKKHGKKVVAGGPHVTFLPEEVLAHVDSVVIGEAESVWPQLLADAEAGKLQRRYHAQPLSLTKSPTPRYDLLPRHFFIKRVVQATRGCPFHCSFCSVPKLNPGFRTRPVARVIADIKYNDFNHWWQRKLVWFWDDNLTIDRGYIKELLQALVPLRKWWLTQASIDIANDQELLALMRDSGCIGVFLGIETFGKASLQHANKQQNQMDRYQQAIARIRSYGICVMAGFISGFDGDTPASIEQMADNLYKIGVDVPFLSILTPFQGTPLYDELERQGRIIDKHDWRFYNGYNVAFVPKNMTPRQLVTAHRKLWRRAFSLNHSLKRIARSLRTLRLGAILLSLFMNGFYCLKNLRGNVPLDYGKKIPKLSDLK